MRIGHSIWEYFFIGNFFIRHLYQDSSCTHPPTDPLNHVGALSRRCCHYNVACRRTARYVYNVARRCHAVIWQKYWSPAGRLFGPSPTPLRSDRCAACAQLKCASMPRRRDPRTCLPVERSRRCHTRIVCCASFRRPDRLRPPINSGRASLYPTVPDNATRLCMQRVL